MLALMALVPMYVFIAGYNRDRPQSFPELPFDRALPLQPAWAIVYGALYLFLILLPVLVIRQESHVRRTFLAYLVVWLTAYVVFLAYPTTAPRPDMVNGDGFTTWSLRVLYSMDPPRNCFPSIHVAHSFVSALACYRLHRGLGVVAAVCAALVGVSTLLTKQHYVIDVVAGAVLAYLAYSLFLRQVSRESIPEHDRRVAPVVAAGTLGAANLGILGFWLFYRLV